MTWWTGITLPTTPRQDHAEGKLVVARGAAGCHPVRGGKSENSASEWQQKRRDIPLYL